MKLTVFLLISVLLVGYAKSRSFLNEPDDYDDYLAGLFAPFGFDDDDDDDNDDTREETRKVAKAGNANVFNNMETTFGKAKRGMKSLLRQAMQEFNETFESLMYLCGDDRVQPAPGQQGGNGNKVNQTSTTTTASNNTIAPVEQLNSNNGTAAAGSVAVKDQNKDVDKRKDGKDESIKPNDNNKAPAAPAVDTKATVAVAAAEPDKAVAQPKSDVAEMKTKTEAS